MNRQPNLVQAEFFHVGNEQKLTACREEFLRRKLEGSSFKTVIRFYDEGGAVTRFVQRESALQRQHLKVLKAFVRADELERIKLDPRRKWLENKTTTLPKEREMLAAQQLQLAIKRSERVAVECLDHSFRIAHRNELHELLEAVNKAVNVFLFVFEPNELLSNNNTSLAAVL